MNLEAQETGNHEEEWRPITGTDNPYEVSSLGSVRAMFPRPGLSVGRIIKPFLVSTNRGPTAPRRAVVMRIQGKKRKVPVHILVCTAFHGPRPSSEHQAAHGDGNGLNNRSDNLRWTLPRGNYDDMIAHGTHRAIVRKRLARISITQISEIRSRRATGEKLDNIAATFGISRSHACAITKGRCGGSL